MGEVVVGGVEVAVGGVEVAVDVEVAVVEMVLVRLYDNRDRYLRIHSMMLL